MSHSMRNGNMSVSSRCLCCFPPQRWALIGYDLDRAGVPGVGCVAASELLEGNPTWEEVHRLHGGVPILLCNAALQPPGCQQPLTRALGWYHSCNLFWDTVAACISKIRLPLSVPQLAGRPSD